MGLIDTSVVTYEVSCTEEEIRARLIAEVAADLGLVGADGRLPAGVRATVLRGDGGKGGYRVRISRDRKQDATPRLAAL